MSAHVTVCLNCERISHGTRFTPNVCRVCGEELVTMSRGEYDASRNYTITVTLTVNERTDEHLQTPQGVKDEVRSWLQGLNATVHDVTVNRGEE